MVSTTPPQASFPISPPLAKMPIGHIDPHNKNDVIPNLQYLKFLQTLWAGVQGNGGLEPRIIIIEGEISIIFGMHGDGTLSTAGLLTVTKTNGVPFGYFATGTDGSNLDANSIPYSRLTNATGAELLGASAAGPIVPITIGTGLSLSGDVLSATGGSTPSTRQILTTGAAATYTTPAGCVQIKVRMVGGGGGGSGSGVSRDGGIGASGGTTTFKDISAFGGIAAANSQRGGVGGTGGTNGTGTSSVFHFAGCNGQPGYNSNSVVSIPSSAGGSSILGGGSNVNANAVANSGGGGGGGNCTGILDGNAGGSGGGAEGCEFIIDSPAASYTYTIGAGGTGGTAGTSGVAGSDGGSGLIIVDEYY